jgi:dephospho-CoA kinase
MILGLTGSIGSGKTFVTRCFEDLGAVVIRADELARDVVAPGTPAHSEILRCFGPGVFLPDGSLNRAELAQKVFADSDARRLLESIIHPRVREREIELIEQHRDAPLVVLEIPLLFESGAQDLCDEVIVVTIDVVQRRARLKESRGMTDEQIDARLAAQLPQEEKLRRATRHIDNSGTREQTRAAVVQLHRQLLS